MRDTLLRHPRRLIVAAIGLVACVAIGATLLISGSLQPPRPAEPPPLAAASAPEPTLISVEATVQATEATAQVTPESTPEPSPFAGIAEPAPQPPVRPGPVHHTVTEGEVLWQIAEQYNLRPETILWANDIQDPDLLLIGQDLLILPTDGVLYTVRAGDHLADVANRYGIDLQAIVDSNHLDSPDQIQSGVDIFLPGGRPLSATAAPSADTAQAPGDDQAEAANSQAVLLPDNIDAMLGSGWLTARGVTNLFKTADASSAALHQLPGGALLERVSGVSRGRIQVRDPGDGRTRQAMTGWVDAVDLDVGRSPATRSLPQAYPSDTAMDIFHVFAPYRSQLDGTPFAEANCGPTALGMALDAFGVSIAPRQLRAEALDAQHMYGNGVGTLITALAQVAEEHGLQALDLRGDDGSINRWSLDDVRAHVRLGEPVIVQVRYRSLPGRGGAYYFGDHYILVTGIVGDGFLYNDPINVDGLGWDRVISGAALDVAMNTSDGRYAHAAVAIGH
jgi:LysM repeat protein